MTFDELTSYFPGGKQTSRGEYETRCPHHEDGTASLGIRVGDKGGLVMKCLAGCANHDVLAAVGLTLRDLAPPETLAAPNGHVRAGETVYLYEDEAGTPVLEVVRTADKHFWQRIPGQTKGGVKDARRLLFQLPQLLQSEPGETIFVVEGEKDCWRLHKLGLKATTNPGGAGKWQQLYTDWLREFLPDRVFVILPDNDAPGISHADAVEASLKHAGLSVRSVLLPGLPAKGDVSDWLAKGKTKADLLEAIQAAVTQNGSGVRSVEVAAAEEEWDEPTPLFAHSLPEFPLSALPKVMADMVEATAEATQTPPDLAGMLSLSVLATAVQKRVEAIIRDGWREVLSIWTVSSLPPGERKSPAFDPMVEPLIQYEIELIQSMKSEIAQKETEHKIAEGALRRAQDQAIKAKTPFERQSLTEDATGLAAELESMKVPKSPRLIADDATPERLGMMLSEQGGRMAVLAPEGDVFDMMAGKYSSGSANIGLYLRGHSGDDVIVDRVGRPAIVVRNAAISFGLTVQPDTLLGLTSNASFLGRGLLGRFLYALPKSRLGTRKVRPKPIPSSALSAYQKMVKDALLTPEDKWPDGSPKPQYLWFSDEADDAVADFERWIEPQLASGGTLGSMGGWPGKLVGQSARIASLLHFGAGMDQRHPVEADSVNRARQIAGYLIPHARAAFQAMGTDPVVNGAREILEWAKKHGAASFTKRDAFNALRSTFARATDLDEPLVILIEHGYLRQAVRDQKPGAGRKGSPGFDTHPSLRHG